MMFTLHLSPKFAKENREFVIEGLYRFFAGQGIKDATREVIAEKIDAFLADPMTWEGWQLRIAGSDK
jgi:hypothetical protein